MIDVVEAQADWFDDAADLIEEYGWVQDEMFTQDGFCLLGACRQVAGKGDGYRAALNALIKRPPSPEWVTENGQWYDIAEWNDETGRTKQEVLDHLRFVAKDLRSNE